MSSGEIEKKAEDALADEVAKLSLGESSTPVKEIEGAPVALKALAHWILNDCEKVVVLSGAGVSVAAGIPDFRSPGTGLYDNLQKYNLPYPEAVFDVDFYRKNPKPFCSLAKEIWPGMIHSPTLTHCFMSMLASKGKLLRVYTQNIDGLEVLAELPPDKIVECHGHFRTAACIDCAKSADIDSVVQSITKEGKAPTCDKCKGYVKPDIVFFGEGLPNRFHKLLRPDLQQADLLIILGTSLQVAPVSMIPDLVNRNICKRVLLNRELVGNLDILGKTNKQNKSTARYSTR
ncbi:NAD-dependent protein deacetylase [Seminavis robusta]|uniref:NAD-dependent protein deacetylase n=1 Tax=Seminavis robusta TaxID=568900 RepID=A0A9N8ES84_9STRA|nr:NAD-dependent protein deacetylase [Seminavis robusta]|eukprot:Sro1953_g307570.1 NAD-dependent protein deacetylase (289) ;mRNA; f:18373-19441